ncbi:DMT family transporter [Motilimonas cestriensis]|uniref:DMT family transporter n=1 Tax=Motilimonas cestriensis TaxID=2742685 RepID=A0ABS8W5R4_9GAMM|nr:DMT family transporter [Motilimonas cestriensis]MCE2594322.1 DMT family transporter [Motilimonas cestriensis]
MSALIYLLMIGLWGFSWIAIKWQQGIVATEVSIFYRFALAALLMFIFGKLFKQLQQPKLSQHRFFALQGLCLFCCNFLAFYSATHYIASGLTAVVMATAPIFNALHGRLFFKTPTTANFWLGVVIGLSGIGLLFGADLLATTWSTDVLIGLGYALLGTWCFSIGNMISVRNTRDNIKPYTATSYSMLYGCATLLVIIYLRDLPFNIDLQVQYLGSLFYLAVPATVMGFTLYLILVDRIGANTASYVLLITPIVALVVSSVFESYHWTIYSSLGLALVILGNVVARTVNPLWRRKGKLVITPA